MKKNNKSRIFSRVLDHLSWANVYRYHSANNNAYKAVLVAKRWLEDCGFEGVKVAFYDREYHIQFSIYRYSDACNHYYTVSASHGYVNDYHRTNSDEMRNLIGRCEFERECTLRRDYSDYQMFQQYAENILFWILTRDEYDDYYWNGNINDIPYDVSIRLWRDLTQCAGSVVNEAIAYRKVVM